MSVQAARYLFIPPAYAEALGGLRWAVTGDLVETTLGSTFAFAPQIATFLEGLMAARRPPHFAHVLHLLHLLGVGPLQNIAEQSIELRRAFAAENKPLRTAGVLCAELTRDVPTAAFAPDFALLKQELTRPNSLFGLLVVFQHEQPALGPAEFESRVTAALRRFTLDELRHWLKHGCAPAKEAGQRVADEIDQRPPNLLV